MRRVSGKRLTVAACLAASTLAFGSSGAAGPGATPGGSAQSLALQVVVPNQPEVGTPVASAPPNASWFKDSFAYQGVAAGANTAGASTQVSAASAIATASSDVASLSLFGGEITADALSGRARITCAITLPRVARLMPRSRYSK